MTGYVILSLIILCLIFFLCVAGGIFFVGYRVFQDQSASLAFFYENLAELHYAVKGFRSHLQAIQELSDFYGEESIKNLLEHARKLDEFLLKFEDMYSAFLEERDLDEDIFALDDEEQNEEIDQEESARS